MIVKKILELGNHIAKKRAESIVKIMEEFLGKEKGKILDVGSGVGHVGFQVRRRTGRNITLLDVKDFPLLPEEINVQIYDGETIPFENNEFDTSLAVFTLHHTISPEDVMKEVARVTHKDIIICEDLLHNKFQFLIEAVKDSLWNLFFTKMTYQYKMEDGWEKMFGDMGLQIIDKKHFSTGIFFMKTKHVAWHLGVEDNQFDYVEQTQEISL